MKKRSVQEWRELFAQQEASGISAAEFCKQNDLCPKHFSVRRKQLNWKVGETSSRFVRAQINTEAHIRSEMVTPLMIRCHASQLAFGALPPPQWLAHLLRALA